MRFYHQNWIFCFSCFSPSSSCAYSAYSNLFMLIYESLVVLIPTNGQVMDSPVRTVHLPLINIHITSLFQKIQMSNGIYKSLIAHNLLLLPFLLYVRMNHIFDQQAQTHTYSLSIPCEYSSRFVCVIVQINSISYIKVGMDCLVHHTLSFYTL